MEDITGRILSKCLGKPIKDMKSKSMGNTRKPGGITFVIEQKLLQSKSPTHYADIQREVEKHFPAPQNIATTFALQSMQKSKYNPVVKVGRGLYTIKRT